MERSVRTSESVERPAGIPLTMQQKLGQGRILLIGTSFASHIEIVLSRLFLLAPRENINLLVSEKLVPKLPEQRHDISCIVLPEWGPLSFRWDWKLVAQLRRQKFEHVVLLYHDAGYRGNRRGEFVTLFCARNNIFSHTLEGEIQLHNRETFFRNFFLGAMYGSPWFKSFFFIYLFGIRIMALFSRTGRRLLFSSLETKNCK